jgi:3-mercaptopyruvate sulfurtransferase SseA
MFGTARAFDVTELITKYDMQYTPAHGPNLKEASMMQRLLMTRRSMLFSLVGLLMTTMLTIWGCGGGGSSYSDPVTTTRTSSAIISAATLKGWIDEGKLNAPFGSQDRVVVVSPSTAADWTTKGHIPGAVRLNTTEFAMNRVEGLAMATNMMPDGAMMDTLIQRLGIDGNTTIVVTLPKNSTLYYQSLFYWNLRYWGFDRDRIKMLNGGDDAWEVAGYTLSTDATEAYTPSTYSVAQNGTLKDVVRGSIGETISLVDLLIDDPTQEDTWQIIDVRGFATSPYLTNSLRLSGYTQFFTRMDANNDGTPDADRNFMWPDRATLETRLANMAVKDGVADVFVSPTKKTYVMCASSFSASPTFALYDAVLNVDEGNVIMYDGSSSQWNNYSSERLLLAYPDASAAQRDAWSFNTATKTRAQGVMATTAVTVWSEFSPVFGPKTPEMNQIEVADRAYMTPTAAPTTGGSSSGGSSAPGC